MSLKVNRGEGGDFEKVPEGQYVARCYSIIDLGTQTTTFDGKDRFTRQVAITWEILDGETKMKDGKPFVINRIYTASLNEKSRLYADLNAWRGKKFTTEELEEFDLNKILGAYAQIQVVHEEAKNGKIYANINAIMSYKGAKPKAVNQDLVFDIDEPTADEFNRVPDFLKHKIQAAPEFKAPNGAELANDKPEVDKPKAEDIVITDLDEKEEINLDDIPF